MVSLKAKDYSIEELLRFANIHKKSIEEVSKSEVIKGIDIRIIRSMQLQKPQYTQFFHKVKEALLGFIDLLHSEQEIVEMDKNKEEKEEHDDGWVDFYKQKIINTPEEATSRTNATEIIDDEHSTLQRKRFSSKLEASKVQLGQGELNGLFRQKLHYTLIVNSQNRKIIIRPDAEIDLLSNSSGKCGKLEDVFIQNPKTYVESESNFTFSLSTEMKNVLQLSVSQIEIPISWYAFRNCNGTTCFTMGPSTSNGELYYPIDATANYTKLIKIKEGNYTDSELIDRIQTNIMAQFGIDPSGNPNYTILYDSNTKKITITCTVHPDSPFNANFNLFFYLEKTPSIAANFEQGSPAIPGIAGNIVDPSCSCSSNLIPKLDNNLGWLLGFRKTRYTGEKSYTSESIIDTYGPKTINVEIDDFTNSSSGNFVVSMSEDANKFSRPFGVEDCEAPVTVITEVEEGLDILGCRPPRNAEHPDKTKDGDFIKSITKNKFWANQQLKNLWQPKKNRTRPYGDNFARLQVKKTEGDIIFAEPTEAISKKDYFGPVTISRINLKLLDEKGEILDLNGRNWTIRIDAIALYQF
jgi:hypothetical protein